MILRAVKILRIVNVQYIAYCNWLSLECFKNQNNQLKE